MARNALIAIVVAICFLSTQSAIGQALAPDASRWFQHLFYDPVKGKAGYHMVSGIRAYVYDIPGGGGSACQFQPISVAVDGTLPPGVEIPPQKVNFEGTPQEPGDWDVTVHLTGLHCIGGSSNYGDRDVQVHFHIDGDAAKSVDSP